MKTSTALASVAITTLLIIAFSFSKPANIVTYYYKCNFNNQRLLYGTTNIEPVERSIEQNSGALFKNPTSWTTTPKCFVVTADMTLYIGSITFNEESTADGGCDGQLTLQEALDALYNQYIANQQMPQALQVCNTVIDVTAATEVCY